jgi:phosphatidate cytidylyltransferase
MTRVLSALVLIPVVVATIWFLPPYGTLLLALVAAVLAFVEYRTIARALGAHVDAGIGGTAVVLTCITTATAGLTDNFLSLNGEPLQSMGDNAVYLVFLAALIATGGIAVAAARPGRDVLASVSATLFAPVYVGLPLGALVGVRVSPAIGREAILLLLAVIVVSDSAQYYTGRALGKRPLSTMISPKKTVEGAIGGVAFGTLAMAIGGHYVFDSPLWILTLLGASISLLGIVGDLFESLLKRSAGVKDSSSLIPGHGGMLDRIDSWLFAAPVYYVFVRFVAS